MNKLSRQPLKGIVFTAASAPVAVGLWYLLTGLFGLDYGPGTLVFTVCFTYFWQIGWSFGGWPANKWTTSRWKQGAFNWVLLMLVAWGTIALWGWYYDKPFEATQIGMWAQTTIFAGVMSLFFFGNELLLPSELGSKQPFAGMTNFVWAVLFVPLGLLFVPQLAGAQALYIPWIWFPVALVVMSYFQGWPFDRLRQPRAGIAYMGAVLAATLLFLAILHRAGTDFFAGGDAGLKAAIFGVIWTDVGISLAWLFNMWPIGRLRQPLKGAVATLGTIAVSYGIYALVVGAVSADQLPAVLFAGFAFLWGETCFAAVGLFNVWTWGYEDDPGGAGIESSPAVVVPETSRA